MDFLIYLIVFFASFIFTGYFQVFIHELGHLIGAKLTGFNFVSFSVGNFILYKKEGKLKFKKSIVLALGQCLVSPNEKNSHKKSFKLYFLGGSIANILVTLICIAMLLINNYSLYIQVVLYFLIFYGALYTILSLIPIKALVNDGYNLRILSKDKGNVDDLYTYLKIIKLSTDGKMLTEMPESYFELPKGNFDNIATNALLYNKFCRYIEDMDFENAKQIWLEYKEHLIEIYKYEFEVEMVFYETLTTKNLEIINKVFTGKIGNYIQATRALRPRLFYAIELLINENHQLANACLRDLDEISKKIIYTGNVKTNYKLVDLVKQHYQELKEIK